jgi:hypothetical protein
MKITLSIVSENEIGSNTYQFIMDSAEKINLETIETHARSMFKIMDDQAQDGVRKGEDDDDKPEFPASAT